MLSKTPIIYPKCAHSLNLWLQKSAKKVELYNKINPQLFDVTLRDGLQTVPKDMFHLWSTQDKRNAYYQITFNYKPQNIEIGSLVNPKVLPIFADSLEFLKSLEDNFKEDNFNEGNQPVNNKYMLIPNFKMLKKAIENDVKHFSFITSVSNAFQKKNTNMTLEKTKEELKEMINIVNDDKNKVKLYISCINECPLNGLIDNDFIVHELLHYEKIQKINELCLSDTCGTLKFEDFEYIIDTCMYFGLPANKISLHLHCSDDTLDNTKQILHYAFDKNINKFDISMLNGGGCSVTMENDRCNKNLTYEIFYKILVDYLEKKCVKN